jgi:phospholipase D-like protein
MVLADYPFLDAVWSLVALFLCAAWVVLLFKVLGDLLRRSDLSTWRMLGWLLVAIALPFIGVFAYVLTQNDGMDRRSIDRARARRVATGGDGAAADLEKARVLLEAGAITQEDFDGIERRAGVASAGEPTSST